MVDEFAGPVEPGTSERVFRETGRGVRVGTFARRIPPSEAAESVRRFQEQARVEEQRRRQEEQRKQQEELRQQKQRVTELNKNRLSSIQSARERLLGDIRFKTRNQILALRNRLSTFISGVKEDFEEKKQAVEKERAKDTRVITLEQFEAEQAALKPFGIDVRAGIRKALIPFRKIAEVLDPRIEKLVEKGIIRPRDPFDTGKILLPGDTANTLLFLAATTKVSPEDIALGLFFTPAFASAAAKKSVVRTATKQETKQFTEIAEQQLSGLGNRFDLLKRTTAKSKSGAIVRTQLKDNFKLALQKSPEKVDQLRKLARLLGGKKGEKLFNQAVKESIVERIGITGVRVRGDVPPTIKGAGVKVGVAVAREAEAQRIRDLPKIVGGEGARPSIPRGPEFERTTEVAFKAPPGTPITLEQRRIVSGQRTSSLRRTLENEGLKENQVNRILTAQKLAISQAQTPKQIQQAVQTQRNIERLAQDITQRQRQRQSTAQVVLQLQRLRQQQKLQQRLASRARLLLPRIPRPRFRAGIPLIAGISAKKKIKKIPLMITGEKFDVLSRKKGKIIRINKKPFLKRTQALNFGAGKISRNLRASFKVIPSSRKGIGKVPPAFQGAFKTKRKQFRPAKSKALQGFFVERKQFRLDSRKEVKKIQAARFIKGLSRRLIRKR